MNRFIYSLLVSALLLVTGQAHAFTSADVFEAIVASHPGDEALTKIQPVPGTNNAWSMLVKSKTAAKDGGDEGTTGVPTILKYAGSKIHISQELAEVDSRVVAAVFSSSDVEGKIEDLSNYDGFSSELTGFQGKVTHDGKRMRLEGSVSVAGKEFEDIKSLLVDLVEETSELYYLIDVANGEALDDYFEMVLDKKYAAILDAQTFVEVFGHGFTKDNQVMRKESRIGHWAWNVGPVDTETINHGKHFEELILLETGKLTEYKQEKMVDELQKRVDARLPKGAKSAIIRPHPVKKGVIAIVLQYPLTKEPEGADIREYHDKFADYVDNVYGDLTKITAKFTQSVVTQEVKTLGAREFMELMNDGLEKLPIHEAEYADGQWKFKYKNVAYIITNNTTYMTLSFISAIPKGRTMDDIIEHVENDIKQNFRSFVEKYEVTPYKNSTRTVWVKMKFNYGMLTSSEITGKKLKEKYHQFTNDIAPEIQGRI